MAWYDRCLPGQATPVKVTARGHDGRHLGWQRVVWTRATEDLQSLGTTHADFQPQLLTCRAHGHSFGGQHVFVGADARIDRGCITKPVGSLG